MPIQPNQIWVSDSTQIQTEENKQVNDVMTKENRELFRRVSDYFMITVREA